MPKQPSVTRDIQQLHQVFLELVIIDPAVRDYQSLATGINPGAEAIILDSSRDGISQIAEILAARPHVQTLHLVSHGGPGSLQLGNSQLNQDNLQQIQTWRQPSLRNILIYGCQVAAGEVGQRFVTQFSHLTGAAVAASSTKTGAANLGGDWELEFRIGDIWAALAFPPQFRSAYAGVFATIVVDTLTDEDDGSLGGSTGISLREAINYSATGDTIQLAAGTYTLTLDGSADDTGATGDLDINGKNLIIIGADQATTIIDASGFTTDTDRVFDLLNGASLDISALTIQGGNITDGEGGGGIRMDSGDLTITNVTITGNKALNVDTIGSYTYYDGDGGGIFVESGTVTITNSEISGNIAGYGSGGYTYGDGGGIYIVDGTVTITDSDISGNISGNYGGGISTDTGTVDITNTTITDNTADSYGGGIDAYSGTFNLTNVTITGNTADNGGGVYISDGTVTIADSEISGSNTAGSYGGGILNYGTLSVNNSTISGNTAADYGGGIYNTGTLEVTNTTISGNEATSAYGGGIYNYDTGDATIVNSTISGNRATYGGGIYNSATMSITNSTIYGNIASSNDGGGIYNSSTLDINNTIVIGNTAAVAGPDVYDSGTITSNGLNIIGDTTAANFFDSSGDITNELATDVIDTNLALNDAPAGSPLTHALILGGPAMDAGNSADATAAGLTTDQRGFPRIAGGAVDIGAVELVPTISITAQTATAAEGGATGVYRITRDFASTAPQSVALTVAGTSTAIAGDYTLSGGSVGGTAPNFTVVIPANAAFVDVTLTATDDTLPELAETVILDVATASDYIVDPANPSATVTISANDPITYAVALASPTSPADEGDSGATTLLFNVTRSGGIDTDSTVNYAIGGTVNATDYNNIRVNGTTGTATGTLSFVAGESSKVVSVDVLGDGVVEPNETLSLTLSAPNKTTAPESSTIATATATASFTVTDDDDAGVTINPTSISTTEAGGTASFTAVLTSQPTADVTVALSGVDATEGTLDKSSLTFTAANWNTAQTVTVTGVDDDIADGAVSYTIVTTATSSDTNYSGSVLDVADVTVSNSDNETRGITVNPTSGITTEATGGNATFTVVLNTEPTADVTIPISSSDTTEGTVDKSSLTFTAANWKTAQTVTITGVDDNIADGSVSYNIATTAATSTDTAYSGFNAADVAVVNADDETPGVTVTPTSVSTTEAGGTATFTVVLNTEPTADVTIPISSSDTTEGTVDKSSLTFTATNWKTAQTVTITGVNDTVVDGNVLYNVVTAAATSTDTKYSGFNAADVAVLNTDNDPEATTPTPTPAPVPQSSFTLPPISNNNTSTPFVNIFGSTTTTSTGSSTTPTNTTGTGSTGTTAAAANTQPIPAAPTVNFDVPVSTPGTDEDDVIQGTPDNDVINGYAGYDWLWGLGASDTIIGGSQDDVIFGNSGNDFLQGSDGNDFAFGGSDNDVASGGEGDDLLWGDLGSDTLSGDNGNDYIAGGASTPAVGVGVGVEDVGDVLYGGAGNDVLLGNQGSDSMSGGDGSDFLFGGRDNDFMYGDAGGDFLYGDKGNDNLSGGDGNDTLYGGTGSNLAVAQNEERDNLDGGLGNDLIFGSEGNDIITGADGDDTMYGGKDNDSITGGSGNDVLSGDKGSDTLTGGIGADKFVFAAGTGSDVITDFADGVDTIWLSGGLTFAGLSISGDSSTTYIDLNGERLATLSGVSSSLITESDFATI